MKQFRLILLFLALLTAGQLMAQDRIASIRQQLDELALTTPGLSEKVELSVSGVSIQEFVRGIAQAHSLNVSINPGIQANIVNNFSNATVSDVFVFLCREYDLEITLIGSIVSLTKYEAPLPAPIVKAKKELKINYNKQTDFLSLDLKRDSLDEVVKEITRISLNNVVLAPGLDNRQVSVYIQNRPFANALEKMAFANGLKVRETDDKFFVLEPIEEPAVAKGPNNKFVRGNNRNPQNQGAVENLEIKMEPGERITVNATNVPIVDIIKAASTELLHNYFLFSEPEGSTTLYLENATYEEFLTYLLNGTDYTYKLQEQVFLIGNRKLEGLRSTELITMENRTIESVIDYIPTDLKKNVEIKEFIELNGLIVSGSYPEIEEIRLFLRKIDRIVPVILIDVMIVEVRKSSGINTGISGGLGEGAPEKTNGTYNTGDNSGAQVSMNSATLNNLLSRISTGGVLNLGNLAPDFYLTIEALETNGYLRRRSTPKLATLNGHEANLSIGEQEYYLETQNQLIGTQNPTVTNSQVYRAVNADLAITIKPFVSGDEQITLEIEFEQSQFTERIEATAPPGTTTRQFKSMIRVRNGETILLGGLEEKTKQTTGSGLPWISKVPVLKWFTGKQSKNTSRDQLNIFIKTTVIY